MTSTGCLQVFLDSLKCVTTDEGFLLPWSLPAKEAVVTAAQLLQWMHTVTNTLEVVKPLVMLVQSCFHDSKSCRVAREKMQSKYLELQASSRFREAWKRILSNIGRQACPIFYQYATDKMLESLVYDYYPISHNQPPVLNMEL